MSIPAQSYAYSIITKGDVMPNYAVIEDVVSNEDGTVRLTIQNGGTWVTVANDAQLSPLRTRNIVTKEDLQKGAEVVLYYDTVAMSYPGQAYTDRVVLLEPAAESVESAKTEVAMVALRDAANELGLGIDWLQDSQTVILSKGAFSATVNIGSTSYGINKMAEELEQAAEIHDGRTYVPQSFVDSLKNALQ
jgi:hypothetical protein